jgi:hypothetical protein
MVTECPLLMSLLEDITNGTLAWSCMTSNDLG